MAVLGNRTGDHGLAVAVRIRLAVAVGVLVAASL
jgi:hypothetical protein